MKNTKKCLSLMVALTVVLSVSVQILAIERGKKVNPQLSKSNREELQQIIESMENMLQTARFANADAETRFRNKLERYKQMYYGNYPYSMSDIKAIDKTMPA
jgi:hypothetical protein